VVRCGVAVSGVYVDGEIVFLFFLFFSWGERGAMSKGLNAGVSDQEPLSVTISSDCKCTFMFERFALGIACVIVRVGSVKVRKR